MKKGQRHKKKEETLSEKIFNIKFLITFLTLIMFLVGVILILRGVFYGDESVFVSSKKESEDTSDKIEAINPIELFHISERTKVVDNFYFAEDISNEIPPSVSDDPLLLVTREGHKEIISFEYDADEKTWDSEVIYILPRKARNVHIFEDRSIAYSQLNSDLEFEIIVQEIDTEPYKIVTLDNLVSFSFDGEEKLFYIFRLDGDENLLLETVNLQGRKNKIYSFSESLNEPTIARFKEKSLFIRHSLGCLSLNLVSKKERNIDCSSILLNQDALFSFDADISKLEVYNVSKNNMYSVFSVTDSQKIRSFTVSDNFIFLSLSKDSGFIENDIVFIPYNVVEDENNSEEEEESNNRYNLETGIKTVNDIISKGSARKMFFVSPFLFINHQDKIEVFELLEEGDRSGINEDSEGNSLRKFGDLKFYSDTEDILFLNRSDDEL